MRKLVLIISIVLLLNSCSKNEAIVYHEKNGLSFIQEMATLNVINYSFISEAVQGDHDTLWVPIALTGMPDSNPRPFSLEVDGASTAEEGKHFKLPPTVFAADATQIKYPVVLLRSADLQEQSRTFTLRFKENEFFKPGALATSDVRRFSTFKVTLTDQILKPTWWGIIENKYYGLYSNEKYRFMIEICGISNFAYVNTGYPRAVNYNARLRAALADYEKENGAPLRDENEQIVSFPNL